MKVKAVTFRMPVDLAHRLRLQSVNRKTTQQAIVIKALERYLPKQKETAANG